MTEPGAILYAATINGDGSARLLAPDEAAGHARDEALAWIHLDGRHPDTRRWIETELDYLDPLAVDVSAFRRLFDSDVVAVFHAAQATDDRERAVAASVAKVACSEALLQVSFDNMRIHGGIGFTWEHDAHLYVRRAKATELMFGSPDHHLARLADLVSSSRHQPEGKL